MTRFALNRKQPTRETPRTTIFPQDPKLIPVSLCSLSLSPPPGCCSANFVALMPLHATMHSRFGEARKKVRASDPAPFFFCFTPSVWVVGFFFFLLKTDFSKAPKGEKHLSKPPSSPPGSQGVALQTASASSIPPEQHRKPTAAV